MNKTKKAMGYYLTIAAAVLAIVGALLNGSDMYKPVSYTHLDVYKRQ